MTQQNKGRDPQTPPKTPPDEIRPVDLDFEEGRERMQGESKGAHQPAPTAPAEKPQDEV